MNENENEIKVTAETASTPAESTMAAIIQNGVSKDELKKMLEEIVADTHSSSLGAADIEKAEKEYFSSHLKY